MFRGFGKKFLSSRPKINSRARADYPDYGCDVELETLGPLTIIDPGRSIEHDEFWSVIPAGSLEPSARSAGLALENI